MERNRQPDRNKPDRWPLMQISQIKAWLCIAMATSLLLYIIYGLLPAQPDRDGLVVIAVAVYMVVLWILQPIHYLLTSAIGLILLVVTGTGSIPAVTTGFASESVFFLTSILLVSHSVRLTGLDRNIAHIMVNLFKDSPSRIVKASPWFVLLMGLLVPSAIARATILKPIYDEICDQQLSCPQNRDHFRRATFLAIGPMSPLVSATYLSGSAAPLLSAELIFNYTGYQISWLSWLILIGAPFLVTIALITVYLSLRYPVRDESKRVPLEKNIVEFDGRQQVLLLIISGMVLGWLFGGAIEVRPALVALVGAVLLFMPGIDILSIKNLRDINWDLIVFSGIVISFSHALIETGGATWLAGYLHRQLEPLSLQGWTLIFALAMILLFLRFFFFNNVPYLSFTLPIALTLAPVLGVNPVSLSFIAIFMSSIIFLPTQSITSLVAMGDEIGKFRKDIAMFGLAQTLFIALVLPFCYIWLWPAFGIY